VDCEDCVEACPYQVIVFNPDTNLVQLCDLCGGAPECVDSCPHGAIFWECKMPTIRLDSCTEVDDLVRGLAFMGTGGGGRPDAARELLIRHLEQGSDVGWTDVGELPDEGSRSRTYGSLYSPELTRT